jgi:hypothetical protein
MVRLAQLILLALLLVIALRLALWMLRRWIVGNALQHFIAHRPRVQPLNFVRRFRDFVFNNPLGARDILYSENADAAVRKMWQDSKGPPQSMQDFGLPADGVSVYRAGLTDNRSLVVVTLPRPARRSEPYLAAVVFPTDALLRDDPLGARATTRFFYLNRGSTQTGRETDLCGWTGDGQERWYNVGAPIAPELFAQVIAKKLSELKL